MPRPRETGHCPHCDAELPRPTPRACPRCAGSLRQKHLEAGCLSSAPKLILAAGAVGWVLREALRALSGGV